VTSLRCKGARDLLPEDTRRFRYIEAAFRRSCLNWGYHEVKTPTLEYLHLFTAAGTLTPSMLNKVYSFLDWDGWSGERVVLRPDGTIPVARLYIENLSQQEMARLFYVTNVFTFEETGQENRERWQCGVERLGCGGPASDAEIINLGAEILSSLGLCEVELQLSHAGVLRALLKDLKLGAEEEAVLLAKVLDGDREALAEAGKRNRGVSRLLSLFLDSRGTSSGSLENLKALPDISSSLRVELDDFARVAALLDALGCAYKVDITSTRGFEYYTGLCFRFMADEEKVGSGGRYDNLVPLIGGKNIPACGLALHIDRLMDLVQPQQERERRVLVAAESASPGTVKAGFELARSLHQAGYAAELDFCGGKSDLRWVVNIGENHLFTVIDQTRDRKRKASSIAAVIDVIGGST